MEINGIKVHPILEQMIISLQNLGYVFFFTSSTRSIEEHINIYKKQYGNKWIDNIPWGSRHLPTWQLKHILDDGNKYITALDCKVSKNSEFLTGDDIHKLFLDVKGANCIGSGIGSRFYHIDVDRNQNSVWYYEY